MISLRYLPDDLAIYFEELNLLLSIPSGEVLYNLIEIILELVTVRATLHVEVENEVLIFEVTFKEGVKLGYRVDA